MVLSRGGAKLAFIVALDRDNSLAHLYYDSSHLHGFEKSSGVTMTISKIVEFWSRIRRGLIDTIERFGDDELDYVATENGYSVRQIILHIAQEERGEIQYGITRSLDRFPDPYDQQSFPTIDSLKGLLDSVHLETTQFLESLDDEELSNDIEAQWGGTYPLIDMVLHVIEHEIHHRGELSLVHGLLGRQGLDA